MRSRILAALILAALAGFTPPAHADTVSADARVCAFFPEWGASIASAERSAPRWRLFIPGTDQGLHRDAERLAGFLALHSHIRATGGRWYAVWLDCNPDA